MYFVYVLYSLKDHRLYKGFTTDPAARMLCHNEGGNASTAKRKPFVLLHLEMFTDKQKAMNREKYLKTPEGNFKLKEFLRSINIIDQDNRLNFSE